MSTKLNKKAQEAAEKIRRWREDPVSFVVEVFNVMPDPWQVDALKAFARERRISMQACKGPGKTATLAWMMWNFMATRPYPKIAATSITAENLSDNLWAELSKWMNRSQWLKDEFLWTKTRVVNKKHAANWFMTARTWPKTGDETQQADTLAGLHEDYMLFVLDESGGIPNAVMATAEAALASGIECKLVQAGNPTTLNGPLHRASTTDRNQWYVIEITSDPESPNRTPRVSAQWAQEMIDRYGREHPWVLVNVMGKFPPSSLNGLFSEEDIEAAFSRQVKEADYRSAQKRLGIDVARFGDDKTIIVPRQGLRVFKWEEMRSQDSFQIASKIAQMKIAEKSEVEFIDDTGGWSAGVQDVFNRAHSSLVPVNFASKSDDPRYMNKRAEMYWRFSEWIKRGALPRSVELKKSLLATKYFFIGNKIQLIDKDLIKQEIGFSPDEADSIVTTFAVVEQESQAGSIEIAPGVRLYADRGVVYANHDPVTSDADPFSDAKIKALFGD